MGRTEQIEQELLWQRRHDTRIKRIITTVVVIIAVAAFIFIMINTLVPIIRIDGSSMENTYHNGQLVFFYTNGSIDDGEIVAIRYKDQIIVKRVIAQGGDIVDIDQEGNVTVNGQLLDEPYVFEKAFGDCTIELPHTVSDNEYFVMGDHRSVSMDSRDAEVGDISRDEIIGAALFR